MTLFDLYPALLLLGVLGFAILWVVRSLVASRVAARRLTTTAMGLLATLLVVALALRLMVPDQLIPSSRLLNWQLNAGAFGSRDPAAAQTTSVVTIEVEHPFCPSTEGDSWIADPIITYTPWSVTITMHMRDEVNCSSQQAPHEGSLPLVGGYLTGVFVPVALREPLGGRALFDGSSFPPVARSLR